MRSRLLQAIKINIADGKVEIAEGKIPVEQDSFSRFGAAAFSELTRGLVDMRQ
jgi:hypothetical protein